AMSKIRNNKTIHSYYKWTNQTGYVRVANPLIDYAIADESWDIVLFQQMSFASLDYSTFQPHLNDLKAHVKANVSNPNVRFGINAIWSRATTSSSVGDEATQIEQFNTIIENYRTAMIDSDLEILIPTGTAIQNGRGNEFLSQVGTELTRDGSHLDEPVGRYIASMTVDRKSTRLNSSHASSSYAVFCLKKKSRGTPGPRPRAGPPDAAARGAAPPGCCVPAASRCGWAFAPSNRATHVHHDTLTHHTLLP